MHESQTDEGLPRSRVSPEQHEAASGRLGCLVRDGGDPLDRRLRGCSSPPDSRKRLAGEELTRGLNERGQRRVGIRSKERVDADRIRLDVARAIEQDAMEISRS